MATVEKYLAQIAERKKSIIEHVRHQIRRFDHHLASNCRLAGVNPPPWLLPDAPAEFKKEDLISGLLFPRPQNSVPCSSSSYQGLYEQQVVRPDNLHFSDVISREIHPLKEGFVAETETSTIQYPESGRFAPETGAATPVDIKDPTTSGATVDPVFSFERVQRSRSRQKYLELRNSAKATKSNSDDAKKVNSCDPNSGRPQFVLQQSSHEAAGGSDLQKSSSNLSQFEGEDEVGKSSSQKSFGNVLSGRVTRFRMDRQQPICAIEPTSGNNLSGHEGNGAIVLTGSLGQLANADSCDAASFSRKNASSKSSQVDELEQLKSAENLQVGKGSSLENCNTVCSGISRGSKGQIKSLCELTSVDNRPKLEKTDVVMCSLVESRPVDYCDAGTVLSCLPSLQTDEVDGSQILKSAWNMSAFEGGHEKVGRLSNKRGVNMHSGRVTSSRSSRWETHSNESPSMNCNCDIAKMNMVMSPGSHDNSRKEPSIADHLFESEQISFTGKEVREMGETEVHKGTFQSNENRSRYACSRVTQSKSPSLQNANFNEDCKMGSHGSQQCCDKKSMLQPNHIYGSSEPVKFDVTERAKTDCQLLENLVDRYVNENSGSQSTLGDAISVKHNNPSNNSNHEVTKSKYNSLSKSPREKSSKSFAGFGGQEASGVQENGLPYTSCSNILGPSIQDAISMATDPDSNGLVKLHSGSLQSVQKAIELASKPKSSDRTSRFLLQDVGSSQHRNSAIVVKPKQLDFEDIGEGHGEASSLFLDKEKQVKFQFSEKCDETSCFQYPEEPGFIVQKNLAGENVRFWEDLMVEASEKTCQSGRISNINILPLEKKASLTHPDNSFMCAQESSEVSKPRISLVDSSPEEKKTTIAMGAPDNAGVDFSHEGLGESDKLKLSQKAPGESSLNVNSGGFPEVSDESDFVRVDGLDLLDNVDVTQTECVVGSSTIFSIDGANVNSGEQQKENLSSHDAGPYSERRCGQDEDNVILPSVKATFHEHHMVEKYLDSEKRSSYSLELSWSQKRRKINGSQRVPSPSFGSKDKHSIEINGNKSPVEADQNTDFCVADTPTSYPELQVDVGLYRLEDKESCRNASFASSVDKDTYEDSRTSLGGQQEVAGGAIVNSNSKQECKAEETQSFLQFTNKVEQQNVDQIVCKRETTGSQTHLMEIGKFPSDSSCKHSTELLNADLARPEMDLMVFEKETVESAVQSMGNFKLSTAGPPCRQSGQLVVTDDVRPEMERFVLQTDYEQLHLPDRFSLHDFELPETAVEHASLLKELSKPYVDTPLSQFMSNSKLQKPSSLFQSAPNGLLECLDTGLSFHANDYINKQLKLSTDWFGEEIRNIFHPRSFSDCCPGPSSQLPWDQKKPCASPVRKIWDTMSLNFSNSGKRSSLKKPELPCISEENETAEEVLDATKREIDFDGLTCSSQRKPLAEIKEDLNVLPSVSEAETLNCRNSLDSVGTAYSFCVTKGKAKQKVENQKTVNRRDQSKLCNPNLQKGANKRASERLSRKLGKQKLSVKSSLTRGSSNSLAMDAKVNNIVSNITSFVPLVQPKPTAPVITGKKDVKVKALEAAEAAKRLAERKQNERNMKKEALKLERARLEQENLKQLELQKKQKEEEKKKKEAQMAAKKRQREEEERLEKERKRKRIEDAMKQQRELEEKMHAKKDGKEKNHRAPDEIVGKKKALRDAKDKKTVEDVRTCNVEELSENKMRTSTASANAALSVELDDHNSKAQSTGGDGTIESQEIVADTIHEQSYDISPYKGSDDEAEEEDDIADAKFIPTWARKSCVALAVASQQNQDPEVIFPLGRSYSTSEVILPRRLQLR